LHETIENMKLSVLYITIFIAVFFVACGPSDEDKARARMNYAKIMLEKQDTTQALLQLDSVALLFPKAAYSVNAAKNTIAEINFDLLRRKEADLDSAGADRKT